MSKPIALPTALPWVIEDPMGPDIGLFIVDDADEVYNWRHVATMNWDAEADREPGRPFVTQSEMRANAELIVTAVNCHMELVEVLAHVAEEAELNDGQIWADTFKRVKAALSKVGIV